MPRARRFATSASPVLRRCTAPRRGRRPEQRPGYPSSPPLCASPTAGWSDGSGGVASTLASRPLLGLRGGNVDQEIDHQCGWVDSRQLVVVSHLDGIERTRLDAQTAHHACADLVLPAIDVLAAVLGDGRLDLDDEVGACPLARHARRALGVPIVVVLLADGPAGPLGEFDLLVRILDRDRLPEEVPERDAQACENAAAVDSAHCGPTNVWPSLSTNPVIMTHARDAGSRTFHPSDSIWSTRTRGSVPRTTITRKITKYVLSMNTIGAMGWTMSPGIHGTCQPPKKSVTRSAEKRKVLLNSERNSSPNFIDEYSVAYPETSSDSASARSNGV